MMMQPPKLLTLLAALLASTTLGGCARSTAAELPMPAGAAAQPQQERSFAAWLSDFQAEARAAGISQQTIDRAFAGVRPLPQVLEADADQPEFQRPIWAYVESAASEDRVRRGREKLSANAALLDRVGRHYGVPPQYLVAIWGLESDFGGNFGDLRVIDALSTLAWKSNRQAFAHEQLLTALRILERGDITADRMVGSWAGAMGHTQFIPTAFVEYAVDEDGDGRRDIWSSLPDVFGSTANHLAGAGWRPGLDWGQEVRLPPNFDYAEAELTVQKTVAEWRTLGVVGASGPLPADTVKAAIIVPAGHRGPAFLVTENFQVILRYNKATSYALAIGHLADRLAGKGPFTAAWPTDEPPLTRDDRMELQRLLADRGYRFDKIDGVVGPVTRAAIRGFQQELGRPADGFPTVELLGRLRAMGGA